MVELRLTLFVRPCVAQVCTCSRATDRPASDLRRRPPRPNPGPTPKRTSKRPPQPAVEADDPGRGRTRSCSLGTPLVGVVRPIKAEGTSKPGGAGAGGERHRRRAPRSCWTCPPPLLLPPMQARSRSSPLSLQAPTAAPAPTPARRSSPSPLLLDPDLAAGPAQAAGASGR